MYTVPLKHLQMSLFLQESKALFAIYRINTFFIYHGKGNFIWLVSQLLQFQITEIQINETLPYFEHHYDEKFVYTSRFQVIFQSFIPGTKVSMHVSTHVPTHPNVTHGKCWVVTDMEQRRPSNSITVYFGMQESTDLS